MKPEAKKLRRHQRLMVTIDRMSVGGRGVARAQGMVIFVPLSAPGDIVEIEITAQKKNFAEARIVRMEKPSPFRISPPCPVAGTCGGCSWQQIAYDEQLRQKRALVIESLRKFSRFKIDDNDVAPTIASPQPFRYRNRVQLHHSGARIGFHKRGSHDIVDIDDCLITDLRLASRIPALRQQLAHSKAGRVELFINQANEVDQRGSEASDLTEMDELTSSASTGSTFSQVNSGQNLNLVNAVVDVVGEFIQSASLLSSRVKLLELYAGSGNFTFPLADSIRELQISAVELHPKSVANAQARCQTNALTERVGFVCADVGDFVKKRAHDFAPQIVLLDPPRDGCGVEVASAIADLQAKLIVYISCHPVTLARDLAPFSDTSYALKKIQPFDMFPQTDHIETLVVLERR